MQFTFVFESIEGQNSSYLLCFIPCPVWKKGDKEIINLHPEFPHLKSGDIKSLIEKENLRGLKKVALVVHETGHGSEKDLDCVVLELTDLGIDFVTIKV
jgi:hypothetical protein